MTIWNDIKDLLFPKRCALCDDVLPFGKKYICRKCAPKMVFIKEPNCMKCGKALMNEAEYCADCQKRKHLFVRGMAVFDYGSIADSLYRFKNRGREEYASFYAKVLYESKKDFINAINPDGFVPVPIHNSKFRKRGYNQSEVLARELSKLTNIPTYDKLIVRKKNTLPLKEFGVKERQNQLKNAFKVYDNDVKLKTIIIIDDIFTTGSTIDEITKTLLDKMDCRVFFLTITVGRGI